MRGGIREVKQRGRRGTDGEIEGRTMEVVERDRRLLH